MQMARTGNFMPLVARSYMHEVPHYIILIRNSCFVNLKIETEKVSVLKGKT